MINSILEVKPLDMKVKAKNFRVGGPSQAEADLAAGPVLESELQPRFEGFEPGPNQFMLEDQEKVISSEPNVQPRTMEQRGGYFEIPQDGPMSSEPDIISTPYIDRATEGTTTGKRFFYGPVIDPREVYPGDPDSGIMAFPPDPDPNKNIINARNGGQIGGQFPLINIKDRYDI